MGGSFFCVRPAWAQSNGLKSRVYPSSGKDIRIGQVPMQVIGILKSEGENSMGQDQDNIVLIPLKTLANRLQSSTQLRQIIGARSRDILVQFLVESMVLCSIGGVTGIALSVGTVTILTQMVGLSAILEPQIAIYAFGFSALVGIFFGFYPAKKASRLRIKRKTALLHFCKAIRQLCKE